ncbi:hypothetical protein BAE44_0017019 [Dichanthelium oligosanthes]|uniref:F-box domain-containing protein n=1 Tax=Dichanthelium oligosanthes TaxID=888268 RepID=A0A1E5VAC0_9POAL|nr:hypothetical protein BAE44_0017019 [Dichanthelium oligosanthes]
MDVIDEDILRLILERIDSHVDLIRAASICKRWHRTIADAIFLRRFRSLHPRIIAAAGDYYNNPSSREDGGGGPMFVPSSSIAIATHHFSLDFLPGSAEPWSVVDSRGSLLLVQRNGFGRSPFCFPDMAVCEPLTRRYMRIPPPLEWDSFKSLVWGSYLIDGNGGEAAGCRGGIGMSNFRVLCGVHGGAQRVAVFAVAGTAGLSWTETAIDCQILLKRCLGRAGGSWYFYIGGGALVVLDGSTGEFSPSVMPDTEDWDSHKWSGSNFYVTDGRDGGACLLAVSGDSVMKVFTRLNGGEWAPEKRILLPVATRCLPGYQPSFFSNLYPLNILTRGTGFVVMSPHRRRLLCLERWHFSVDLETMEVALVEEDMGPMAYRGGSSGNSSSRYSTYLLSEFPRSIPFLVEVDMDVINEDILRLILGRIGSSMDLIRASSTCKQWRRNIADAVFLRRFRSLHARTIAGDCYDNSFTTCRSGGPLFVPSSSVAAHHFSLDFLPDGDEGWSVVDSRGNLLLVDRPLGGPLLLPGHGRVRAPDPALQENSSTAGLQQPHLPCYGIVPRRRRQRRRGRLSHRHVNFRVLCPLRRGRCEEIYVRESGVIACAAVFTAVAGAAGSSWTETAITDCEIPVRRAAPSGRSGGSWYFYIEGGTLIVLDGSTGEFSASVLPATEDWDSSLDLYVTDSRDGEPRLLTVHDGVVLKVFARLNGGGGGEEWALEKRILLQEATRRLPAEYQSSFFSQSLCIVTRGTGFVVLSPRVTQRWRFSVDLETMAVAPVDEDLGPMAYRCELPWPLALHACLD